MHSGFLVYKVQRRSKVLKKCLQKSAKETPLNQYDSQNYICTEPLTTNAKITVNNCILLT